MAVLRRLERWLTSRVSGVGRHEASSAPASDPVAGALRAAIGACFAVLVLTGVALMTAYAPSRQSAWASVHYIEFLQPYGWLVRGLHSCASQAMLVLAVVHIAYGGLAASYRAPRELHWWASLAILGLTVAQGITGGLLPWDQRGWWARQVEGNIVGLAPVVGRWLEAMFFGGSELGALGLTRVYTLHVVVLTCALGALLVFQAFLGASAAGSRPALRESEREATVERVGRDPASMSVLFAAATAVALLGLVAWLRRTPLDGPADPMSDYPARPEWFLLPLYELRKFFHGSLEFWGTTLLPGVAVMLLALLPWLDANARTRRFARPIVVLVLGVPIGLGLAAHRHDAADPQFAKARAEADARASAAIRLAMAGVPPEGALAMVRRDPELRGRDLFAKHCASCHVLADLGDPEKATAAKLDGWGATRWITEMIHAPDAPQFFGRSPYEGEMPSVDERPRDPHTAQGWSSMVKNERERAAVALFLVAQGDSPGDVPAPPPRDAAALAAGEKIVSERCTACHLYKGEGDDQGTGIAPELSGYGSEAWTRAQVANPASAATYREAALDPTRKKHMPRFDKELSATDVTVVAQWTRTHARAAAGSR